MTGSKVQNRSGEPEERELVGSFRVLVRALLMAHTFTQQGERRVKIHLSIYVE